ncbi:dioxygenase family protein [Colwellia sp. MEBiC06753]
MKVNRRKFIQQTTALALTMPVLGLIGCGDSSTNSSNSSNEEDNQVDNGNNNSGDSGNNTGGTEGITPENWLSGGTQGMYQNFPDTSLFDTASTCAIALTPNFTEGPCYFAVDVIDDISAEQVGLPCQLCLQVVDQNCVPQSGLEVEVWHCDVRGIYSGDTSSSADADRFAGSFCTANDTASLKSTWFRGTAVTDSDGRVNFKTCFPGWYSSRTIHIHFRVKNNNNDQVISQFAFTESLTTDICTLHPEYADRGIQDTPIANDTVFRGESDEFIMDVKQNEEGSLLLYKTIMIN